MNLAGLGWIASAGAGAAFVLLLTQMTLGRRLTANWTLALGLAAFGVESLLVALSAFRSSAPTREAMVAWHAWSEGVLALVPGSWLLFALTYARGNSREFVKRWLIPVLICGLVPLVCAPLAVSNGVLALKQDGTELQWQYTIRWPTLVIHGVCLLSAVAVLVNLEWTFRASVGMVRWRIKYAVLGFAILFGARIYTSSQVILYSGITVALGAINSAALLVACLLAGVSFARSRLEAIDLYPSSSALYRSLTATLIGVYLVLVGLLFEWISPGSGDTAFPIKALALLLAIAALGIMIFSDNLRQRLRILISRHFARPLHDYRQVWSTFTERTAGLTRQDDYCQAVVKLVAETFDLLSVSLWLDQDGNGRFP
jgi:hypothetical protein